ncbi:hypothetical protein NC653_005504 [Populus alba x Populus x berolinensis]|uniref:Uncharacterized protein n=1 Tax=Populus alba x Populus x berolinensis TaxID=444605 RepID=A0AAD6RC31_9ROSI|nr:hypothetical protein NC653_005504 [Populus alba x Populus x berolinensis]
MANNKGKVPGVGVYRRNSIESMNPLLEDLQDDALRVSYGEVFYSPSTKTVSMNEYLSSRASGTIKDKIRRSLEMF